MKRYNLILIDASILAVLVAAFALYQFVLPQPYAVAESAPASAQVAGSAATAAPVVVVAQRTTAASTATTSTSADLGGGRFADRFTSGDVVSTATSYASANVNVALTEVQQDGVTYYVEDIYVRNVTYLRTAFAQNTYGRSIVDWPLNIAAQNNAVAAINGDYYGAGTIGTVIRNGKLYSRAPSPTSPRSP